MEPISEQQLIELLDKRKTRLIDKDLFWKELKNSSNIKRSYSIEEQNLIIDIPDKEQRDRFIRTYASQNLSYGHFEDETEYINNDNNDSNYSDMGTPLFIAEIDKFSSLKEVYISLLESFNVGRSELRIKNIDEMEYRIISLIKIFSVEIILINYTGKKLLPSEDSNSIFYSLCKLSELCKISFNILGSISPRVYFNEKRKTPIGFFYSIDGINNCKDVHFETTTLKLNSKTGKFVEVK